MSNWSEERRANKRADAEVRILEADAAADRDRKNRAADDKARRADRAERRTRVAAARRAAFTWLDEHQVHVTIALLGVASVVMAVPAMASYGHHVYGDATGIVLPVLSELGAWAFAFAVQTTRRKHADRPVWALQLGVWLFAAGGAALNVLHGIDRGWDAAAVMGFAAVAGIVAHQLAVASPRRSATDRADARLARASARKAHQVRRAAIDQATAEIDPAGQVALRFPAGEFRLASRGRLEPVIDPDPFGAEERAIEAARRVLGTSADPDPFGAESTPGDVDGGSIGTSSIGVLDRPDDQRESRSTRGRKSTPIPSPKRRSIEEIREQFKSALTDPGSGMNPTSAESIRKTLRIAPDTARQLRDEHQNPGKR